MKIIKHGKDDIIREVHLFDCGLCGCIFEAGTDEIQVHEEMSPLGIPERDPEGFNVFKEESRFVSISICPECSAHCVKYIAKTGADSEIHGIH